MNKIFAFIVLSFATALLAQEATPACTEKREGAGRFQIVTMQRYDNMPFRDVIKIDTATGRTWALNEVLSEDRAQNGSRFIWTEIPDVNLHKAVTPETATKKVPPLTSGTGSGGAK